MVFSIKEFYGLIRRKYKGEKRDLEVFNFWMLIKKGGISKETVIKSLGRKIRIK